MVSKLRDEWINDPTLKKWCGVSCIDKGRCRCSDDSSHVELWDHDHSYRGRIDTVVCTSCDVIIDFDIIR